MSEDVKAVPIPLTTPMEALVAQAMAEKLTVEAKDKLLTAAITGLLREKKGGSWGVTYPSDLAEAFSTAVAVEARKLVQSELANSAEFKERLRQLVAKVLDGLIQSDELNALITNITTKALSAASASL